MTKRDKKHHPARASLAAVLVAASVCHPSTARADQIPGGEFAAVIAKVALILGVEVLTVLASVKNAQAIARDERTTGWAAVGAAGGVFNLGAGLGDLSQVHHTDDGRPMSFILLGIGAVAVGLAVGGATRSEKRPDDTASTASPLLAPGQVTFNAPVLRF